MFFDVEHSTTGTESVVRIGNLVSWITFVLHEVNMFANIIEASFDTMRLKNQ